MQTPKDSYTKNVVFPGSVVGEGRFCIIPVFLVACLRMFSRCGKD